MDFLSKLERKFGKFAIPNLTMILIAGFVLGYMILIFTPEAMNFITMNPNKILEGQVYRLFTWVVIPPRSLNLFVIIMLMFYFSIGRALEDLWGDFRYTLYIVSGIIFTDIGMMLAYFMLKSVGMNLIANESLAYFCSTYYLCMSLFLAYAFSFPDNTVLLYFIIPIKTKWLGYLDLAYLIFEIIQYGQGQYYAGMVTVIMSILNFVIFFIISKKSKRISRTQKLRKKEFRKNIRSSQIKTKHKCAICGRTNEDDPNLEFRYCSRCKGNYEYCQDHLFTHEHKK